MAREKLHDKWFRFLGIPLIAFLGHIIFYNRNESGEQRFGFWIIYLLSLAETMILWEVNRLVFLYYRNRFPSLQQTKRRITYAFIASMFVTIIVRGLNVYLFDKTKFWGYRFPFGGLPAGNCGGNAFRYHCRRHLRGNLLFPQMEGYGS
jgi:hypothetical protein